MSLSPVTSQIAENISNPLVGWLSSPANGNSNSCSSQDPAVQEAVDRTLAMAENSPEPHHTIAYQIEVTMNDPSLTQEQKDEYITTLLRMANGGPDGCGSVSAAQSDVINRAFDEIGRGNSGRNGTELRQQVTDSIARSVDNGCLGSGEIYGLVKDPGTAGARQLLTGIRDGSLLSDVSQRLVNDARHEGYDINKFQYGPQLLTAAADIANMAAANGDSSAADAVLAEIDRATKLGPVAGDDMTLVQAMMATSLHSTTNLPGRDGFHALAGLLGSSSATSGNQEAQDRLFAELVRSGDDNYIGGIDQGGDRTEALDNLGEYFEKNFSRLAETDWRKTNTGDFHHGLIRDFMRHVLLDADYGRVDQTNDAIATEMHRLVGVMGDTSMSANDRETAASTLGAIMGSLEAATADFIANAKGNAEQKVEFIRFFTDKLTDKLISKGAGHLPEGDVRDTGKTQANNLVDKIWKGLTDWMASGEIARANDVTGGMLALSRIFRDAMSDGETFLLNAFDLREDLYYDP